jgi:hypothetical protein
MMLIYNTPEGMEKLASDHARIVRQRRRIPKYVCYLYATVKYSVQCQISLQP